MFKLNGKITYKDGSPVVSGDIILKDSNFKNLYQSYTNKNGEYDLIIEKGNYPFLMAVKDYGTENLEYWCKDIPVYENVTINASIDKIEIYGLHVFNIDGGADNLMIYCRPMNLDKLLKKEIPIIPDMNIDSLDITINDKKVEIIDYKEILEIDLEDNPIYGLTINVLKPDLLLDKGLNFLDIKINDKLNNFGQASIYF